MPRHFTYQCPEALQCATAHKQTNKASSGTDDDIIAIRLITPLNQLNAQNKLKCLLTAEHKTAYTKQLFTLCK